MKKGIWLSYGCTAFCIVMGFYKMFVYENSELYFKSSKNVYVGGDAYNYIINSNYATSWFVLAGVCAVIGLIFVMVVFLDKNNEAEKVETIGDNEL